MAKREHRPTQCSRIVKYIQDFGSITTWQAFTDLGVARLGSRLFDLKEKGYVFSKERIQTKNRYGEPTHYYEYRIIKMGELI